MTDDNVREIVRAFVAGEKKRPLARRYGVTAPIVRKILRGDLWNHVTGIGHQYPDEPLASGVYDAEKVALP